MQQCIGLFAAPQVCYCDFIDPAVPVWQTQWYVGSLLPRFSYSSSGQHVGAVVKVSDLDHHNGW